MVWISQNDEEGTAIWELATADDRTAAITAGSILERRLEAALKHNFHHDEDIIREMFRESGPLGAFSTKIRLGFMLGIYGREAEKDLQRIKDIRNQFAHQLWAKKFSVNEIKTRCDGLKLVDKHIFQQGPDSPEYMPVDVTTWQKFYIKDRDAELADPKTRYLLSVMILSTMLTPTIFPVAGTPSHLRKPLF